MAIAIAMAIPNLISTLSASRSQGFPTVLILSYLPEEIFKEFYNCSGYQFDPYLLEVFITKILQPKYIITTKSSILLFNK